MAILYVCAVLIVIGVALWAFNTFLTTIDPTIKKIINTVVVLAVVFWLLWLMLGIIAHWPKVTVH